MSEVVKKGDLVSVHYTGTLTSGDVFDSSRERDPLQFEVGAGQMIPGFDSAVEGMKIGEVKDINIPCAEAYGEKNDKNVIPFPKTNVPEGQPMPKVGEALQLMTPEGQPVPVTVLEVTETEIIFDANHPLAGQDLNFNIEVVKIG